MPPARPEVKLPGWGTMAEAFSGSLPQQRGKQTISVLDYNLRGKVLVVHWSVYAH